MQAKWILAINIIGYIRFVISGDPISWQAEYEHLFLYQVWRRNPRLQVQKHKKPCENLEYLSKWVCVSIFHNNDYGSSRDHHTLKLDSDTRQEFARDAHNKGTIKLVVVSTTG